jgi:hypothetical protein
MPLPTLPTVGGDVDNWGTELNAFLNAVAARPMPSLFWRTGQWYASRSTIPGSQSGTLALNATEWYASPLWVPEARAIDRVGVAVSTGVAASVMRLAAYGVGSNGLPGPLLFDFGTVSTATSGEKEITVSVTLPSGIIFLAGASDGAISINVSAVSGGWQGFGASSQAADAYIYRQSHAFPPSPSSSSAGFARFAVRAA